MNKCENISLLPYNTFRMDVKAAVFAEYASVEELRQLLEQYRDKRILHIGSGSNLLFTGDFDGVILHSAMRRAKALDEDSNTVLIEAENGLVLDELIAQLCDMGLSGMENLSYIPGEVGASAVQNVGAYGVEAKDVIVRVRAISIADGTERVFENSECQYGYRFSRFKAEWKNRKAQRGSANLVEPLYTMEDAVGTIRRLVPFHYDEVYELCEGIQFRFTDVGHLLGSASIEVWLEEGTSKKNRNSNHE